MKGTVLDFSIQQGTGLISGDDGNRYTFSGSEWKAKSAPNPGIRVDFAASASDASGVYLEIPTGSKGTQLPDTLNVEGLSPYYREEFKKIWDSKEAYKGKWNWAAFFFGGFWALTKGTWLSAVISLGVCAITMGIGGVAYWFIFGMRGNYIYYSLHVKRKQLVA